MNKLFDKNITLNREDHIYNLATNPDLKFISATTFIDSFFEKFDSQSIAEKLVVSLHAAAEFQFVPSYTW